MGSPKEYVWISVNVCMPSAALSITHISEKFTFLGQYGNKDSSASEMHEQSAAEAPEFHFSFFFFFFFLAIGMRERYLNLLESVSI